MTSKPKDEPKPNHLLVEVITAAGSIPPEGADEVPIHQPVKVELKHAAKELGITNTVDWIAVVDGRELDIEKDYAANNLSGHIVIKYGPRETGGGAATR
jgi:hypothetical protein